MIEHTVRAFDADLQELASDIAEMGKRDDDQVAASMQALITRDDRLAERVIAADDRIDSLQVKIEQKAVETIARRQPMATDLREIVGALRMSIDLERIGDLAENVAKRVLLLSGQAGVPEAIAPLQAMTELVRKQLADVLQSYASHDADLAKHVWKRDQEVDALNNAAVRELLTYMMENPRNVAFCTQLIFSAKDIERIGDHSTNLAETVVYVVEGRPITEQRPKADLVRQDLYGAKQ